MSSDEIFVSAARSEGDSAGVFEYDGETAYFYLYNTQAAQGQKVTGSIHVLTGRASFSEDAVAIRWDTREVTVGLFIKQQLWAAFDANSNTRYGGDYPGLAQKQIPSDIVNRFR